MKTSTDYIKMEHKVKLDRNEMSDQMDVRIYLKKGRRTQN